VLCAAGLDRLLFLSALQQQQQQHHQTCWQECCQHLPQLLLQDMACCLACCREGNWDTCQHQLVLLLLQQRSGNCSKRSGWQQAPTWGPIDPLALWVCGPCLCWWLWPSLDMLWHG